MDEQVIRFKRSEKVGEIIVVFFVVALIVVIQLPITPQPDKTAIYIAAVVYSVFTFAWHNIKLPLKPVSKSFIESVTGLLAIFAVVHASGGSASHFNFLYILPNLHMATTSTKWHTFSLWSATVILMLLEALVFSQPESISFALLNIWALILVSFYGRALAKEVGSAQGAATEATIDKEKSVNKLKDEFVFVISHEIRGPITAIRGYLELFLTSKEKTAEPVKNLARLAFKQSEKLNNLIIQLLDLSRLETGKFRLTNEKFDLNQFLKGSLETVKIEAEEKKIKFEFREANAPVVVFSDKERIKEILLNLLGNAFKYTGEFGKVWLWLEVKENQVYLSVADTGVGISPEELPQVFTRFYKPGRLVGGQNIEKGKNAGLGLYLTKQLVDKLGGQISVESKLGKGSKFTFALPLAKTAQQTNPKK